MWQITRLISATLISFGLIGAAATPASAQNTYAIVPPSAPGGAAPVVPAPPPPPGGAGSSGSAKPAPPGPSSAPGAPCPCDEILKCLAEAQRKFGPQKIACGEGTTKAGFAPDCKSDLKDPFTSEPLKAEDIYVWYSAKGGVVTEIRGPRWAYVSSLLAFLKKRADAGDAAAAELKARLDELVTNQKVDHARLVAIGIEVNGLKERVEKIEDWANNVVTPQLEELSTVEFAGGVLAHGGFTSRDGDFAADYGLTLFPELAFQAPVGLALMVSGGGFSSPSTDLAGFIQVTPFLGELRVKTSLESQASLDLVAGVTVLHTFRTSSFDNGLRGNGLGGGVGFKGGFRIQKDRFLLLLTLDILAEKVDGWKSDTAPFGAFHDKRETGFIVSLDAGATTRKIRQLWE